MTVFREMYCAPFIVGSDNICCCAEYAFRIGE